ncbi:hypothetical protein ACP4OV_013173 [Aristida adscensionis]
MTNTTMRRAPTTTLTAPPCPGAPAPADNGDDLARQIVMGRWRSSLASGLRAALAITIVGVVSLYAPPALRRHITFPAFSYVVTVIVVTDATLGTALRGAAAALHATLMGAAPSVVALWLAHRTGAAASAPATAAVVALTAFAVALPESASPAARRIALGQIIIVYVARFRRGERPTLAFAVTHPADVVACTALGVAAALLAVALPWPRLAAREAGEKGGAYRALAAERVRVMVDAFLLLVAGKEEAACGRHRRWQMVACMSRAERLASACSTLLRRINSIKEDLQWERAAAGIISKWWMPPPPPRAADPSRDSIEAPLAGMHMALALAPPRPCTCTVAAAAAAAAGDHVAGAPDHDGLAIMAMRDQIRLALLTHNSIAFPSSINMNNPVSLPMMQLQWSQKHRSSYEEELAPLLFLFSLHLLHRGSPSDPNADAAAAANAKQVAPAAAAAAQHQPSDYLSQEEDDLDEEALDDGRQVAIKEEPSPAKAPTTTGRWRFSVSRERRRRLTAAAKCGASLGLAVLLGLLFSGDHGFWSGLIVATTMTAARESTWGAAAARAHGTALGSVYGALGCLLLPQRRLLAMDLRFLALLPWIVLAAFLKRSRAYGPAGAAAAALSAIIVMGRRYDELPMAFAAARLVETFIGIACAALADLAFQPGARPAARARAQLAACVAALRDCAARRRPPTGSLQSQLALLRKYTAEAAGEPTYLWMPPFPAASYGEVERSLGKMARLLRLYLQARAALMACSCHVDVDDHLARRRFDRRVSASLEHCLRVLAPDDMSSPQHVREDHADDIDDLESGHHQRCCCCKEQEEAMEAPEEVVDSFLAHAREALQQLEVDDNEGGGGGGGDESGKERGLLVCCVGTIGLCMGEMIKKALRLEAQILRLNDLQPH